MEFSVVYEVENQDITSVSKSDSQETASEIEMQDIENNESEDNPVVEKNTEPASLNSNAKTLLTSISNIKLDLKKLLKKISNTHTRIASPDVRNHPIADTLHFELDLLKAFINRSKCDLKGLLTDVNTLLLPNLKTCGVSSFIHDAQAGRQQQKLAEIDELSNSKYISSASTSHCRLGTSGVPPGRLTRTTGDVEDDDHEDNLRSGKRAVENREAEEPVSKIKKQKPAFYSKFLKKKLKFQCHLCGAMTQKGNDHMKENHPDEKDFPCQDCGEKFNDFESMFCHMLIHRQKKATNFNKGAQTAAMAKTASTFAQVSCEICGEILRNSRYRRLHLKQVHNVQAVSFYPCLVCDEVFYFKIDLHSHLDEHSDNGHIKCKVCDESFVDALNLREHLLEHNKKHSCEVCGKKYFKAENLKKHRKSHFEQKTCEICGRNFRSQKKLDEHMNKHTGEKPFECEICHVKLCSSNALKIHKQRKHSAGGVKCFICGKRFLTPYARNSHHLSAHTEEERRLHDVVVPMFKCDICGKVVRAERKKVHLITHKSKSERKCHVCEICGESFFSFSKLKEHMFYRHDDRDSILSVQRVDKNIAEVTAGEYICDICGRQCANKSSLCMHKWYQHKGGNQFRPFCDICGKQYASKGSLMQHKINCHSVFDGRKLHVCQICGKAFRTKKQLELHGTVHTGTQPYRCEICGKGLVNQQLLTLHSRVHTGDKPYTCQFCGLSFSLEGNLKRHISTVHNKERKFHCEFCSKSFGQKTALMIHRRQHTGEKPYSCSICNRSFADPSTLHKHKQLHSKK